MKKSILNRITENNLNIDEIFNYKNKVREDFSSLLTGEEFSACTSTEKDAINYLQFKIYSKISDLNITEVITIHFSNYNTLHYIDKVAYSNSIYPKNLPITIQSIEYHLWGSEYIKRYVTWDLFEQFFVNRKLNYYDRELKIETKIRVIGINLNANEKDIVNHIENVYDTVIEDCKHYKTSPEGNFVLKLENKGVDVTLVEGNETKKKKSFPDDYDPFE